MPNDKEPKPFRVFLTRHYIAVQYYDVEAKNGREAVRKAEKAARKLRPDARAEATDNGWIADDPTPLPHLGYSCAATTPEKGLADLEEVAPDVYADKPLDRRGKV